MSFFATRRKDGLDPFNDKSKYTCPHIDVHVGSRAAPTSALIDSGAEFSCVSEGFCNQLKASGEVFPEIPVVGARIITATGQRSQRIKRQCLLPVELQGLYMDVRALIVPSLVKELVLGADWLSKHGAVIGYRDEDSREIASGECQLKLRDGRSIYILTKDTEPPRIYDDENALPPPETFITATSMEVVEYIQSAWEMNDRGRLYSIQEDEGEEVVNAPGIYTRAVPPDDRETAVKELWTADEETGVAYHQPHICAPVTYTNGTADPESACAHPHAMYAAVQEAQDWWTADCESSWDEDDYTEEDRALHFERYCVNTCFTEEPPSEDDDTGSSDGTEDGLCRSMEAGRTLRDYPVQLMEVGRGPTRNKPPDTPRTAAPPPMDRGAGQSEELDDFLLSLYGKY